MPHLAAAAPAYLSRWLTAGSAQPPLLLVTPPRSPGLEALLVDTKLAAVCTAGAVTPCRTCYACHVALRASHPDLIDVAPTTATWRIKDVHIVRSRLARTSISPIRVVILRDAERFQGPAAPALLKMLEEPAPSTRYLLVTAWPQRLLPTIRSRCHVLRLPRAIIVPEAAADFSLKPLLKKISRKGDTSLNEEDLAQIAQALAAQLQRRGPSPALRRAFSRLRDYYLIASRQGNTKLAGDVVVLSVPTSDGM